MPFLGIYFSINLYIIIYSAKNSVAQYMCDLSINLRSDMCRLEPGLFEQYSNT